MPLRDFKRPIGRRRVIDLVAEAGIDVSHWADYGDGARPPGANPAFCYEWAFHDDKVCVLSLWYDDSVTANGAVFQRHNLRKSAEAALKINWRVRARRAADVVTTARDKRLPVRVIVCDGEKRRPGSAKASRVTARELDPVPWAVTAYDVSTGAFVLTRGATPGRPLPGLYPDEADVDVPFFEGKRKRVIVNAYERDRNARDACVAVHGYRCAVCDLLFSEMYGEIGDAFIHVHHLKPLSHAGGLTPIDPIRDLVPVCPNCHAMLHQASPPFTVNALRSLLQHPLARPKKH